MDPSRRLRVILLPPNPFQPERDRYQPDHGPDPFENSRWLAASGIDIVLIDPGEWPRNPFAGKATLLEALDPLRALRVLVRERGADIIVSVFEGAALPLVLLRRLLMFPVPVVLWDLGLTESWKLRERVLDRVVPRVDGILVLSTSQQSYIAQRWGRRDGVEVIGAHVDCNFFRPAADARDGPVLAIGEDVGRDFDSMLAAAEGLDANIVLKTRLVRPDRVLPRHVSVMRERLDDRGLRDLFASSRIVVVPLYQVPNSSGVSSILEASAMCRPLVVSEADSIRDFIVPGETCLTVPCGDPGALRASIQRLLDEPDTCARLGMNARRFVEENFSKPAFSARLAQALWRYPRPIRA